jgi:DNA-directed RNA polymerase subunit E'/Rpb7
MATEIQIQQIQPKQNKQYKAKEPKNVYSRSLITESLLLPISVIGRTLKQILEQTIISMVEGKCIVEGYVKPGSVKVITYSSGIIKGDKVLFEIVYECEVCFPVAGMLLNCVAKNITKAGIRAESSDNVPSPFVLFVARDHYFSNDYFNSVKENDKFMARVIAQRFELNDKYISIIAEIVIPKDQMKKTKKPKLIL